MRAVDVDVRAWPISPIRMERAALGNNNDSYFVTAREGEFVLRVYRNTAEPKRVHEEHELLGRLLAQELPFETPAPVKTRDGDTMAVIESPEGPRLGTLFFRIPGEPATLSVANAFIGGRALAQLDAALARVDLPLRLPATLRDVHELVPDPIAALEDLELGDDLAATRANLERALDAHDALAASLPTQIVHGDYAFANLLVKEKQVTGMVDFEFAGADFRAADLACALYLITVRAEEAARWPALEAFVRGYGTVLPLDPLEVAALPDLMLRRSAIGLVHWIGRWRQGIAPRDEPLARVRRGALFARWLERNDARVVTVAAGGLQAAR